MRELLQYYFSHIKVGRKQTYKNLSIFPVLSGSQIQLDYLVLDEALTQQKVEIQEIDDIGTVPELKVLNHSYNKVFIIDGEELIGAKQNRIVNASFLIPPRKEVVIPVSCVEQGRWSYTSKNLTTSKIIYTARARRSKHKSTTTSLRLNNSYITNQHEIWNTVSGYIRSSNTDSQTMAFNDYYKRREVEIERYIGSFKPHRRQIGNLVFINGEFLVFDAFFKYDTIKKVYTKLLRSYAMDAIDKSDEFRLFIIKNDAPAPVSTIEHPRLSQRLMGIRRGDYQYQVGSVPISRKGDYIYESMRDVDFQSFRSIGRAVDVRFESSNILGNALLYKNQIVHMSFFGNGLN